MDHLVTFHIEAFFCWRRKRSDKSNSIRRDVSLLVNGCDERVIRRLENCQRGTKLHPTNSTGWQLSSLPLVYPEAIPLGQLVQEGIVQGFVISIGGTEAHLVGPYEEEGLLVIELGAEEAEVLRVLPSSIDELPDLKRGLKEAG
jgi:hypothetical protein